MFLSCSVNSVQFFLFFGLLFLKFYLFLSFFAVFWQKFYLFCANVCYFGKLLYIYIINKAIIFSNTTKKLYQL